MSTRKLRSFLGDRFGDRVNFNKTERILYGHDIAAVPSLVRPLIGNTTPDAVVQPQTEEELSALMQWASRHRIPLTPRGKGSSGYGGVLPLKKGVVVDFYRMSRVVKIDEKALTATVQPGIVWEKLDRELEKHHCTLRLYPTSYPSSTVGGWLAQGGAGIGSFESGWFRDNVVSARVVQPDGKVREFRGADLGMIADAEGITGLISEVTIRIRENEEMELLAVGCPNPHDVQRMVQDMIDRKLPIWSLVFINPHMAEMKNRAPLMMHYGHPAEERVLLPAAYITVLAFRKKDAGTIRSRMPDILKPCEGEILSDRIARHEWEHRFKLMVVKRLGPSLVPTEIVFPLSSLGEVLTQIERKVHQPVVKEGVVIRNGPDGGPEVVILGFMASDQRKFKYNFVFSLVLTIMKIVEKNGGRSYSTGIYFAGKAGEVLGPERLRRLKAYKREVDPHGILNPGKVIRNRTIGTALSVAGVFEPLIRPFGNQVISKIGERPGKAKRDIPGDVAWYAYGCSQCGYCIEECDQFYGRGWESQSPRGKWYWLREYMEGRVKWDQFMIDTFLVCTTCEFCNLRCSAALPIEPSWMKLRGLLINEKNEMTFPPFEVMGEALDKEGDIWAGYRKDRASWFDRDLWEKHGPSHKSKTVYFAGCTASYVEHDIGMASVRLLDAAGVDFSYLAEKESCCGTPMLVAGKWKLFEAIMRRNIHAVKEAGADRVVTSCPACDMMWRQVYPAWAKKLGVEFGITVSHYSEVVSEKIRKGEFTFPARDGEPVVVTWHDSCHIGRVSGVYEPPRELIRAVPNTTLVEMSHNREHAHCCGSVLTLIKDPLIAHEVGKIRLDEAVEAGAQKVLALCPCCEFQLRVSADKKNMPLEVVDLARYAASALGYDFPDPNPEVKKQWAVFEAMIALMTPRGFAGLMSSMLPETVAAMPFGMGGMMRFFGRIPGALRLMKPLFPVLFPRLLPLMMPELMPVILERVANAIPMPDYMAEQMPVIMPKVMNTLMPHMVHDLVPLVSGPLIAHLQGR
jgi:Fe-S oxidoreductase/FAD/FMN-containing dehydrogenase